MRFAGEEIRQRKKEPLLRRPGKGKAAQSVERIGIGVCAQNPRKARPRKEGGAGKASSSRRGASTKGKSR